MADLLSGIFIAIVLVAGLGGGFAIGRKSAVATASRPRNFSPLDLLVGEKMWDGMVIQDMSGTIEWCNQSYQDMTGFHWTEIVGRKPQEFVLPEDIRPSPEEIAAYRVDPHSDEFNGLVLRKNLRADGSVFWNQISCTLVEPVQDDTPRVVLICRDVTAEVEKQDSLTQAQQDLRLRAETDGLTGLKNRPYMDDFLERVLAEPRRTDSEIGLLHIDLDHFKQLNDTYGHLAGDVAICHVAGILQRRTGENGIAARMGGDEFLMAFPGCPGLQGLADTARSILSALAEPLRFQDSTIRLSCSIGAAISSPDTDSSETLIRQADFALYQAKNGGRGDVGLFDKALEQRWLTDQRTKAELVRAIDRDEFELHFQPIVELSAGRITGFEGLLRWNHPERGLLSPAAFLDRIRDGGLSAECDALVVRKALAARSKFAEVVGEGCGISINVFEDSLLRPGYIDRLKWEVDRHDTQPGLISIEVLEQTVIEGPESPSAKSITQMAKAGFRMMLDDFGTGQAGLANLDRLRLSGVKLDRSMVREIESRATTRRILQAIIDLCADLNLAVVAEGIETGKQAALLLAMGVPLQQGYWIAPPMSLQDALDWVAADQCSARMVEIYTNRIDRTA